MRSVAGYVTKGNGEKAGKRLGNRLDKNLKKEKSNRL